MGKRHNTTIAMLAAAMLTLAACSKDHSDSDLQLVAEGMNGGGAKVAVAGNESHWATGDRVRIGDEVATVSIDRSTGTATAGSAGSFEAPFYGVYPAGIYVGNSGDSYTLDLPHDYTYTTVDDGGTVRQNLQSPMVAYAASGNMLLFKHVTAAIGVQVVNYYGFTIAVDSIVVSSPSYKLCGRRTVTLGASISVSDTVATADTTGSVRMLFGGSSQLHILAGDSATVQLPVLPVGAGNRFTVKTYVHKVDQPAVAKCFERTQATGGSLIRANIGYARFATPGLFSVSASQKVIISQGNLQYNKSSNVWSFPTTQYGTVETTSQNVGDDYANQNIVTLFGWGTSGWDNCNRYYMPYHTGSTGVTSNGYGYGPVDTAAEIDRRYIKPLTGNYANADWGVYNAIQNGGNVAGRWHTLTANEWKYLLNETGRKPSGTVNGTTYPTYTYANVCGTNGLVIFPDGFNDSDVSFSNGSSWGTINAKSSWTTVINAGDWELLEAEGVVFLPAAGYRDNKTVSEAGSTGCYWSSNHFSSDGAHELYFNTASYINSNKGKRNYGASVRLVHNIE